MNASKRLLLGLVLLLGLQTGCASIFTGTRQHVEIQTSPSGAQVVVIGGKAGLAVLAVSKFGSVTGPVLRLLGSNLDAAGQDSLKSLEPAGFIISIVLALQGTPTSLIPEETAQMIATIPGSLRKKVLTVLAVKSQGASPHRCELKKGGPYAVLAWTEGYRGRGRTLGVSLNGTVFLNIFNFFVIGVPIDILTGAWMNLDPEKMHVSLEKR